MYLFLSSLSTSGLPSLVLLLRERLYFTAQCCYPGASLVWSWREGAFCDLQIKSLSWAVYWGCGLLQCFRLTSICVTFSLCCLHQLQPSWSTSLKPCHPVTILSTLRLQRLESCSWKELCPLLDKVLHCAVAKWSFVRKKTRTIHKESKRSHWFFHFSSCFLF